MTDPAIEVVVQIGGEDVPAGRLWAHRRNVESATFAYEDAYLARADAYELDPTLPLAAGQQQTPAGQAIFGAFSDCAPDRWGRRLIKRAERQRVDAEGGAERSFGEVDYLLGARDDMRQGALRFRRSGDKTYLTDEEAGVPPVLEISHLLSASERMERDEAGAEELALLLRGGSSLGGARPKAHVLGLAGELAIAKFPSPKDEWDVIRWEGVAATLARKAGVTMPASTIHPVDGRPVLVISRRGALSTRPGRRRSRACRDASRDVEVADRRRASRHRSGRNRGDGASLRARRGRGRREDLRQLLDRVDAALERLGLGVLQLRGPSCRSRSAGDRRSRRCRR
jgi:serine/threonine-protein kinase HipA